MANLEQITRPAQSPSIRPVAALGMRAAPVPPDPNIHTWGAAGSNVFQLSANFRSSIKPAEFEEEQRKFDVVRVKNPNDSSQHVDVEVMTEYQSRNKIDKSRTTLRFAMTTADDSSEILSRGNVRTTGG